MTAPRGRPIPSPLPGWASRAAPPGEGARKPRNPGRCAAFETRRDTLMEYDRRVDPDKLREARLSKVMSRQAVAHEVGCLLPHYARIESGAVEPTESEAVRLISLFGAEVRAR